MSESQSEKDARIRKDRMSVWEVLAHTTVIFTILGSALVLSIVTCQAWILPASGALIVVAGIMLEYGSILRTRWSEDLDFWTTQRGLEATQMAIVIVVFGTLIQGFGDPLLKLIEPLVLCSFP